MRHSVIEKLLLIWSGFLKMGPISHLGGCGERSLLRRKKCVLSSIILFVKFSHTGLLGGTQALLVAEAQPGKATGNIQALGS